MIRARLSNGSFVFGIDAENLRRLKAGQPIVVDMAPMGGHDSFLLLYGETQADLLAELERANGGPLPEPLPLPRAH